MDVGMTLRQQELAKVSQQLINQAREESRHLGGKPSDLLELLEVVVAAAFLGIVQPDKYKPTLDAFSDQVMKRLRYQSAMTKTKPTTLTS